MRLNRLSNKYQERNFVECKVASQRNTIQLHLPITSDFTYSICISCVRALNRILNHTLTQSNWMLTYFICWTAATIASVEEDKKIRTTKYINSTRAFINLCDVSVRRNMVDCVGNLNHFPAFDWNEYVGAPITLMGLTYSNGPNGFPVILELTETHAATQNSLYIGLCLFWWILCRINWYGRDRLLVQHPLFSQFYTLSHQSSHTDGSQLIEQFCRRYRTQMMYIIIGKHVDAALSRLISYMNGNNAVIRLMCV